MPDALSFNSNRLDVAQASYNFLTFIVPRTLSTANNFKGPNQLLALYFAWHTCFVESATFSKAQPIEKYPSAITAESAVSILIHLEQLFRCNQSANESIRRWVCLEPSAARIAVYVTCAWPRMADVAKNCASACQAICKLGSPTVSAPSSIGQPSTPTLMCSKSSVDSLSQRRSR
jgi:hypothetical protein